MSLLQNLPNMNLGLRGLTPNQFILEAAGSKLHNQYSINNRPKILGKPQPSTLDLDGLTPSKYLDNSPR